MRLTCPSPFLIVIAGLCLTGCGDSAHPSAAPTVAVAAPHQGTVFPLGGDKGNVEILNLPTGGGKKSSSFEIVAYFYTVDMTPLASTPSDVSFRLEGAGGTRTIALKPKADRSGFASAPGPYGQALTGELVATIDGQPVTVNVSAR